MFCENTISSFNMISFLGPSSLGLLRAARLGYFFSFSVSPLGRMYSPSRLFWIGSLPLSKRPLSRPSGTLLCKPSLIYPPPPPSSPHRLPDLFYKLSFCRFLPPPTSVIRGNPQMEYYTLTPTPVTLSSYPKYLVLSNVFSFYPSLVALYRYDLTSPPKSKHKIECSSTWPTTKLLRAEKLNPIANAHCLFLQPYTYPPLALGTLHFLKEESFSPPTI